MPPEQESMLSAEDAAHLIENSIVLAIAKDARLSIKAAFDNLREYFEPRLIDTTMDDIYSRFILSRVDVIMADVEAKREPSIAKA